MAKAEPQLIGRIRNGAFETVGRSETWADQRTVAARIVGQMKDIADRVKPGDSMAQHANWFDGAFNGQYFVKNLTMTTPDGVTGELNLSLVKCPSGKTKPYSVTWDVSMEEVQLRLISHPMVVRNCDVEKLLMWEDTMKSLRVRKDGDKYRFYYLRYEWSDGVGIQQTQEELTGEWEKAYCLAVTQGIETFNRYLPVVTKVSSYLELAGASYSADRIITGGTISDFSGSGTIGHYDAPELKVSGFVDGKDGVWFKNCDKYTSQADGSWTRTEGWVFTNDPKHMWIYTNQLGK